MPPGDQVDEAGAAGVRKAFTGACIGNAVHGSDGQLRNAFTSMTMASLVALVLILPLAAMSDRIGRPLATGFELPDRVG